MRIFGIFLNSVTTMHLRHIFASVLLSAVMAGCGNGRAVNEPRVSVERFDRAAASYISASDSLRASILRDYAPVIDVFGSIYGMHDADSVLAAVASSPAMRVFQPDVEKRLPDLGAIEARLGGLKSGIEAVVEGVKFPKRVFGIVTPYEQTVVFADSVALVGLNHYLGSDYEGYQAFDSYKRQCKSPDFLVYDFAKALLYTQCPFREQTESKVLSRLIYEGAVISAVMRSVPDADPAHALGYTSGQLEWADSNMQRIWHKMVADGMIYSVDKTVADRLVAKAPHTTVIHPQSPGALGTYVGYLIVESYLAKHPETSPGKLLSPEFYNDETFLVKSGFRAG